MMRKLFFLLFLLSFNFSFSQEKTGNKEIDSLLNVLPNIKSDTNRVSTLNGIAKKFSNLNPNQGILYSKEALELSQKIKFNDGIVLSYRNLGELHAVLGDLQLTKQYFDKAMPFAISNISKCIMYRAYGTLFSVKSNYSKALEYHFKALKICEIIKDENEMAKIYFVIGGCYYNLRNTKNSLLYTNKSIIICRKINNQKLIFKNYDHISNIYRDQKKYDLALQVLLKSAKIASKLEDDDQIANVNIEISRIYKYQNKFKEALEFLLIGQNKANKIKNRRYITNCKIDEAQIYLFQYDADSLSLKNRMLLNKAEKLLNESFVDSKMANENYNMGICKQSLSELYLFTKNYKKAAKAAIEYAAIKDSIFSEKSKETVKNLEDQRTIDLKNKEILINKITLESKEKQKWIYIIGIGFLTLLGGLLFYQSQNRKKTNQELQILNNNLDSKNNELDLKNSELDLANKTKIRFLSILNHDLRSPVYNFIHFMQLQKESPELLDIETKKEIEDKTILSAENLLISMEDILLWSKGQMENFEPQPKLIALDEIFDYAKKHFESEEKVKIVFENPDNLEIYTDENFLKTIIRNFTGNGIKALKGTQNPSIIWKVWRENSNLYLSISDNGSGSNQEKFKALYDENEVVGIKTGLGLHLIRDIAKAINCEITVQSSIGIGTIFTLKFQ